MTHGLCAPWVFGPPPPKADKARGFIYSMLNLAVDNHHSGHILVLPLVRLLSPNNMLLAQALGRSSLLNGLRLFSGRVFQDQDVLGPWH